MAAIDVDLEAVIVAVTDDEPRILVLAGADGAALPSGRLDPEADTSLDRGLRRWVTEQTGLDIGYVEQLYTFGDKDRHPTEAAGGPRVLSVAYLALVSEEQPTAGAAWRDWYDFLPWEDHRRGVPDALAALVPQLREWAGSTDPATAQRVLIAFGVDDTPWDEVRVLERYELLYQAQLVPEWHTDHGKRARLTMDTGNPMVRDNRRIIATALSRLRGKLSYRALVFEVLPETFTLLQLQRVVEALAGVKLHKQNFRRVVGGLVEGTGGTATDTGGRPAELFRFRREVLTERPRPGVRLPGH